MGMELGKSSGALQSCCASQLSTATVFFLAVSFARLDRSI